MRISALRLRALPFGRMVWVGGAAVALLLSRSAAPAAEFRVEKGEVAADTTTMCVTLTSGGDSIVATQNDLTWDPSCATLVGDCTAGGHGKDLHQAHPAKGRLKAIIISFSDTQSPIPDGDLYCCQFHLESSTCSSTISIENASASPPGGSGPKPHVAGIGGLIGSGSASAGGGTTGGGTGGAQSGSAGGQQVAQGQPAAAAPAGGQVATGGGAPAGGGTGILGNAPPVPAAPVDARVGTDAGRVQPVAPRAGAPDEIAQAPATGQEAAPAAEPTAAATPAPTAAAPAAAAPASKPAVAAPKAPTKVAAVPAVAPTKASESGGCHCQVGPSAADPLSGLLGLLAPVALLVARRFRRPS